MVGVWGCGPIGLSIAKLALFRGAKKVYAVDPDPRRLEIAESFGCIGVNVREHPDVSDYILRQEPHGLDKGIEASGFRSAQSWIQTTMRAIGELSLPVAQHFPNCSDRCRRRPVGHGQPCDQGHPKGR